MIDVRNVQRWVNLPSHVRQTIRKNGEKFGAKDFCFSTAPFFCDIGWGLMLFVGFDDEIPFQFEIMPKSSVKIDGEAGLARLRNDIETALSFAKWLEEYHNKRLAK